MSTILTMKGRDWTTGVPVPELVGLSGVGDDTYVRDWIVPPPGQLVDLPELVRRAHWSRVKVGWALTSFHVDRDIIFVPWPFVLKRDERDDVSAWLDHEPDAGEVVWLNMMDERDT